MWLQHAKVLCGWDEQPAGPATSRAGRRAGRRKARPSCEVLEGRQLLSGVTASFNGIDNPRFGPTDILVVTGTKGNDNIHITESGGKISITGVEIAWTHRGARSNAVTSNVSGLAEGLVSQIQVSTGSGNDTVRIDPGVTNSATVLAGNGTDSLITGGSNDVLNAGTGTDTLIALGGSNNVLVGGRGASAPDSFWYDNGATVQNVTSFETSAGMVHDVGASNGFTTLFTATSPGHVTAFTPTLQLNGQKLPDPPASVTGTTEQNFSSDPLFASGGPSPSDVAQGAAGDCTFLAAVLGIVTHDPQEISQMIVSLGDGTYAVDLKPGGVNEYVRVNADLPVNASGQLVYAKLGQQNSLWVALLEKAWTFARPTSGNQSWWLDNVGTYNNINGGGPGELFTQLDDPVSSYTSPTTNLFSEVVSDVAAGKIVCVTTYSKTTASSGLVGAHAYYVDHVNYVSIPQPFGLPPLQIPIAITLRNPWGYNPGSSSPFITITPADVQADLYSSTATTGHP
jgi:hypothetical protein